MKNRLIFILLGIFLLVVIAFQTIAYVKKQTIVLKKETSEKWVLFSKSFDLLLIDLKTLKKDSSHITINDDLFKFLNTNIAHNSIKNTDSFELFCYQLNKKYFQQVSYSNIQKNRTIQNRLSQLNELSIAYNDIAKKHNVFVGTVPNFYIIKENQRKRMPYFSVRFNQKNLDPTLYKKRFNSYIETGQDRFLNEPNKN